MPRRVQDILPGERRSIRDIPTEKPVPTFIDDSKRRRSIEDMKPKEETSKSLGNISIHRIHEDKPERMSFTPPPKEPRRRKKGRLKWLFVPIIIILCVAGLGYAASFYYSKASFTIKPKAIPFSASGNYVSQAADTAGGLTYALISLNGSASTTIPATNGAVTSTKSQGKVTLYNSYSATSVRLIAGTRIANDNGLVYRLESSISIPGMIGTTPGKLTTTVIADQAGQEYNIPSTDAVSDFKIVAYKGTTRYDTVYAKIASSFTGGYSGTKKIVNPKSLASTSEQLASSIRTKLLAEAQANIPEGYIMFDNAYVSSMGEPVLSGDETDKAIVSQKGTLYGILFKKKELASKITGGQSDTAFGDMGFEDPEFSQFKFSIVNAKDFSPTKKNNLIFNLKGDTHLVAHIPVDEIKARLGGLSSNAAKDVFREYSSVIEQSSGELVPKWAKVPRNPERINIVVKTDL